MRVTRNALLTTTVHEILTWRIFKGYGSVIPRKEVHRPRPCPGKAIMTADQLGSLEQTDNGGDKPESLPGASVAGSDGSQEDVRGVEASSEVGSILFQIGKITDRPDALPLSVGQSGRTPVELPGQFGRYQILEQLGKGAMGAIYLAQDTQLNRKVALKVPHLRGDDDATPDQCDLDRFYREAHAAATLDHPSLCPVYDVGQIGGIPYLTMAYIKGKPLSAYIVRDQPMAERRAAIMVRKLAQALEEAHYNGVVHRDLKPSNIMVNARGELIIMDFGLACASAARMSG